MPEPSLRNGTRQALKNAATSMRWRCSASTTRGLISTWNRSMHRTPPGLLSQDAARRQRVLGAAAELAAFKTSVMAEKLEKAAGAVQRTGYEAAWRGLSTCNGKFQHLSPSLQLPVHELILHLPQNCENCFNKKQKQPLCIFLLPAALQVANVQFTGLKRACILQ